MTNAELSVPWFPAELGYSKTLSTGKLACCNVHALRLGSKNR